MRNLKKWNFLGLFALLALFAACNNNDDENPVDNTPPTVSEVTLNNLRQDIRIAQGERIDFRAKFEDNVELGQFKIDIHDNFDGHSHGRIEATPFEFVQVYNMSGRIYEAHEEIAVPADAATGMYHFIVQFFDAAGNEGEFYEIDFEITGDNQPQIALRFPNPNAETDMAAGDMLVLQGMVTSEIGLAKIAIKLFKEDDDDHDHEGGDHDHELYEKEYIAGGINAWDLSNAEAIQIPADLDHAHLELIITAFDTEGNTKTVKAKIHVD
ncbi:MAG: DUF4625 domain-containing protein [Bernardetiaceae bacterium]|nr:DUF4625 domain-containing protein [Bernardetiaceae bacterium]